TEDGERLGGGDVRIHPHGFDDGQFVLRLGPEIGAHPPHTSFGSCPARASFCPASLRAGMAPSVSVSRSAASTWSGTGRDLCVARDTMMIASVEHTIPMPIGSMPVLSTRPASCQPTEDTVPRIIEAIAPGTFAFFHQAAAT